MNGMQHNIARAMGRFQFSLRFLLVVIAGFAGLLALLGPWQTHHPGEIRMANLDERISRVRPGMSLNDLIGVFRREPQQKTSGATGSNLEPNVVCWTFYLTDEYCQSSVHGMPRLDYIAEFSQGKLTSAQLHWRPEHTYRKVGFLKAMLMYAFWK